MGVGGECQARLMEEGMQRDFQAWGMMHSENRKKINLAGRE